MILVEKLSLKRETLYDYRDNPLLSKLLLGLPFNIMRIKKEVPMDACCYILSFVKDGDVRKYIGHTTNFQKRIRRHLEELSFGRHHNSILQTLYDEGWRYNNTPVRFPVNTKEQAYELEQNLIEATRDDPVFVNIELRYDTLSKNPRRESIINSMKETILNSIAQLSDEERLEKYSRAGKSNGMFGKSHTESSRNLIREKLISFYEKHGSPLLGVPKSAEHRAKISEMASKRTGSKNSFFGRSHTDTTKQKLAELNRGKLPPNTRKVVVDGTEYESLTEAGRQLGLNASVVLWRIKSANPRFSEWKWF